MDGRIYCSRVEKYRPFGRELKRGIRIVVGYFTASKVKKRYYVGINRLPALFYV